MPHRTPCLRPLGLALLAGSLAGPLSSAQTADPFGPRAGAAVAAPVGPLSIVTLATDDGAAAKRFFAEAMGMSLARDATPPEAELAVQRRLWNAPPSLRWRELRFERPQVQGAIAVRVLVLEPAAVTDARSGELRPDMQARLNGGLSLGFPIADMRATERRVARLGVGSTAGITSLAMPRGDGSDYTVQEIHYRGPEHLYALGVSRPRDMTPVGPIDPRSGVGGPAYSGMVVVDGEREVGFFRDVLGWELRRDITMTTQGPTGGLALPAGTRYRFLQLFAPGTNTGYLVMLDMMDSGLVNPLPPRLPNQGLIGWTFATSQFDETLERARRQRVTIVGGPLSLPASASASVPARAVTLLSPSGLQIELVERPAEGAAAPGAGAAAR